jgi:hypothetical protein
MSVLFSFSESHSSIREVPATELHTVSSLPKRAKDRTVSPTDSQDGQYFHYLWLKLVAPLQLPRIDPLKLHHMPHSWSSQFEQSSGQISCFLNYRNHLRMRKTATRLCPNTVNPEPSLQRALTDAAEAKNCPMRHISLRP